MLYKTDKDVLKGANLRQAHLKLDIMLDFWYVGKTFSMCFLYKLWSEVVITILEADGVLVFSLFWTFFPKTAWNWKRNVLR